MLSRRFEYPQNPTHTFLVAVVVMTELLPRKKKEICNIIVNINKE